MPTGKAVILAALLLSILHAQVVIVNFGCRAYEADGTTCKTCSTRFWKDGEGICQPVSDACKDYNKDTGACTACYEGDFLVERVCIPDPRPLANPYCAEFSEGACIKCSLGFYLEDNTCTMVDPLCKTFDYDEVVCVECYVGYGLLNGECKIEAAPQNQGCAEFVEGKCEKCSQGYYFGQGDDCLLANTLCRTFDQSNGDCLSCFAGFRLEGRDCVEDEGSSLNPFCAEFDANNTCIRCSSGYYFDNDKVCQLINPLCKTFDFEINSCAECFVGFELKDGNCELGPEGSVIDPNCKEIDADGKCLECSQGAYFNSEGRCQVVSASCKTFDFSQLVCTECYEGFDLNNGTCIQGEPGEATCAEWLNGVCAQCVPRAYFDFDLNCVMVSDLCDGFNDFTGECTSCFSGFTLSNGQCVVSAQAASCVETDANDVCVKCSQGSYLQDGQCIPIDTFCKDFNLTTLVCDECYQGYSLGAAGACELTPVATQASVPNCVEFSDGLCTNCFNMYYLADNTCNEVDPLCKSYDKSNGDCTSCYSLFTLTEGKCVFV